MVLLTMVPRNTATTPRWGGHPEAGPLSLCLSLLLAVVWSTRPRWEGISGINNTERGGRPWGVTLNLCSVYNEAVLSVGEGDPVSNINPFRTAVPFRGKISWNLTGFVPKMGLRS